MKKEYRLADMIYDEGLHRILCHQCGRVIEGEDLLIRVMRRWICDACALGWAETNGMPKMQVNGCTVSFIGSAGYINLNAERASELLEVIIK